MITNPKPVLLPEGKKPFWEKRTLFGIRLHDWILPGKPESATWPAGWNVWHEETRRAHPVRYFLAESVPRWFGYYGTRINDAWWWLLHRVHPRRRYHKLDLRRGDPMREYRAGWIDAPHQMELAISAIVRNFVEGELAHLTKLGIQVGTDEDLAAARELNDFFQKRWPELQKKRSGPSSRSLRRGP